MDMEREQPRRTTMDDPLGPADDPSVREEEARARDEAARIGGPGPELEGDEAERAVREAGGGEAEGFEEAEDELVEQASHGDDRWDPELDARAPEAETDRASSEYGEPDELD
jgi:hypothetical protein